jgi:hypothetical protein
VSDFKAEVRPLLDKPFRDVDDLQCCNRQPQLVGKLPVEHFISKNPDVLRIVRKFRDVTTAVGSYKKVRLRSSAKFSNMLDRGNTRAHSFTPRLVVNGVFLQDRPAGAQ